MALACAVVPSRKNKRMQYWRHSERNDSEVKNPEPTQDMTGSFGVPQDDTTDNEFAAFSIFIYNQIKRSPLKYC